MKSLFGICIVLAEGLLAYLWLALGYEAAGRMLIFYLWAWAILLFFIAGIVSHPKYTPPKIKKSPLVVRYFHRGATGVRVLGLAAIGRPVLAGIYLIGAVLMYLIANGGEKRAPESKEGGA
ncbi:hypothetical protein LMG24238_06930 [Paraburkholderia sediminicola]|uniref:Uncharacterized protein n=1 Tax=Paraburkholderia sediminicola TaxID=458836 RepID=A0A6J5CSI4_9BURK|nr:hypothetical protein [Paraburkholderia sediminicola]CAB3742730.1 hypothetical protein LMG24238_06930 [Paraburkholderia sediminicola]